MTRSEILKMKDSDVDKNVKIQGTRFDRKRKVSNYTLYRMKQMFEKGMKISEIANKLGLTYLLVRYNVDEEWKKEYNLKRSGKHTGNTNITREDRINYKRDIVNTRKMREFT